MNSINQSSQSDYKGYHRRLRLIDWFCTFPGKLPYGYNSRVNAKVTRHNGIIQCHSVQSANEEGKRLFLTWNQKWFRLTITDQRPTFLSFYVHRTSAHCTQRTIRKVGCLFGHVFLTGLAWSEKPRYFSASFSRFCSSLLKLIPPKILLSQNDSVCSTKSAV